MTDASYTAVDRAARASYGRLVALLAARSRDVDAAEEALAEAFAAALKTWPVHGVPGNPEAWLLTAARRRMSDDARRSAVRERAEPEILYDAALSARPSDEDELPDRRLELMFACAHPAIDPAMRTPLIRQAVLGIDAAVIAAAFLSAPSAMAQRLVRAKRKIRDAGIRLEIPAREYFPARLEAVLEAIYGAFGTGWDAVHGGDAARADLSDEAIDLGRLVTDALPDEAEPLGLLALMLYCEARRTARRDGSGQYVPLTAQSRRNGSCRSSKRPKNFCGSPPPRVCPVASSSRRPSSRLISPRPSDVPRTSTRSSRSMMRSCFTPPLLRCS